MPLNQTYAYVLLEVSDACYEEITKKLRDASYDRAINEIGEIDMHGIALVKTEEK